MHIIHAATTSHLIQAGLGIHSGEAILSILQTVKASGQERQQALANVIVTTKKVIPTMQSCILGCVEPSEMMQHLVAEPEQGRTARRRVHQHPGAFDGHPIPQPPRDARPQQAPEMPEHDSRPIVICHSSAQARV